MQGANPVIRDGESVSFIDVSPEERGNFYVSKIAEFCDKGYKSVGIICKNETEIENVSKDFEKNGIPFHFIFLGIYYWSLGTDGKPYKDEDIEWLAERLEAHKGEKCFVITHLFFPDRAGNLLEIYPQGNWLQGEQLTKLENLCKTYPNTIWFSGHSHWKWYLQKYQATENVYQNEQEGSYCVHISGCASPIDSNGQPNTSGARVTKPLESEGAIVDVYEDYIDIRCIDLKNMLYLPIAQYRLTMKK